MLSEQEVNKVQKYCIYPSLAVAFFIMSILIGGLLILLVMIADLVFDSTSFYEIGLWVYLGIVAIYLILFIYCFLSVKLGMRKEAWKQIVEKADVTLSNKDYSKQIAGVLGTRAAGSLLKQSDDPKLDSAGNVLEAVSAIGSIVTISQMSKEASNNAKTIAHIFHIPIPKVKKYVIAIVLIPMILLTLVYIPHYVDSKQASDHATAIASKSVYQLQDAFETDCDHVRMDDPKEQFKSYGYDVTGYLYAYEETYNSYISVTVDNNGVIEKVHYVIDVDMHASKEANIEKAKLDILKLNVMLNDAHIKAKSNDVLETFELPEAFVQEFLSTSDYKTIRYDVNDHIDITYITDSEEDSYIYFDIQPAL